VVTFTAPRLFTLVGVGAHLKTAGNSVTTVDLYSNNKSVSASAVSFQSGEKGHKELADGINLRIDTGHELVIRITAAGSSAAGLKYHIRGTI
jgi:hypothetical protein